MCDNNVGKLLQNKVFGLECITVDELCRIENVCVVIMLGAAADNVKKQLDMLNIKNVYVGDLLVNMYTEHHEGVWSLEQKEKTMLHWICLRMKNPGGIMLKSFAIELPLNSGAGVLRRLRRRENIFQQGFFGILTRKAMLMPALIWVTQ